VDIDECRLAEIAGQELCNLNAGCVNIKTPVMVDPAHSAGYMCVCHHGYFTTQLWPTVCSGQGFDVSFFLTEKTRQHPDLTVGNYSGAAAISVVYLVRKAQKHVLELIQQRVVGVGDAVLSTLFEISSVFAEQSISYEATSAGMVWKVCVRIAAAFIDTRASTFRDIAATIRDALHNNETWNLLQLHTHVICSGAANTDTLDGTLLLYNVCTGNTDCAGSHGGVCDDEVAYLQVQTVETSAKSSTVQASQAGDIQLISVRFDMDMRRWKMEVEFVDGCPDSRRILILSKTREINGGRFIVPPENARCGGAVAGTHGYGTHVNVSTCVASLSETYTVLASFDAWAHNSSTDNLRDFSVYRDLATGPFSGPLLSCEAQEHIQINWSEMREIRAANTGDSRRLRRITVSLGYDDVVSAVGSSRPSTAGMDVNFFVGLVSLEDKNGTVSSITTTRDILTKIGSHFVLSHDITDEQDGNRVVPDLAISLNIVSSPETLSLSWGFVRFYITLPRSAVAAGVTFDDDVIPIDSVVGSIAFFENGAVDTNPYPCIYRPDGESYRIFSEKFACARALLSVSRLCCHSTPILKHRPVFKLHALLHTRLAGARVIKCRKVAILFKKGCEASQSDPYLWIGKLIVPSTSMESSSSV